MKLSIALPKTREPGRLRAIERLRVGDEDGGPGPVVGRLELRGEPERLLRLPAERGGIGAELLEQGQVGGGDGLAERLPELPGEAQGLGRALEGRVRTTEAPERVRLPGPGEDLVVQALRLLEVLELARVGLADEVVDVVAGLLEAAHLEPHPRHHGERRPGRLRALASRGRRAPSRP